MKKDKPKIKTKDKPPKDTSLTQDELLKLKPSLKSPDWFGK